MKALPSRSSFVAALSALASLMPSFAAEFVVEPFDGDGGTSISSTGSGTGWGGTWTGPTAATYGSGNSFIANGVDSIGTVSSSAESCALSGGADLTRALDATYIIGDDIANGEYPELFLSFLVENPGPIPSGHEFRTVLLSEGSDLVSFGKRINRPWTLRDGDEELNFTTNAGGTNIGTWFSVIRLAYDGTDTIATGYLAEASDPALDLTDLATYPRTAFVTLPGKASFDGVRIYSHNTSSARMDEIRIADDLANVTATPDPLLVIDATTATASTNTTTTVSLPISNAGTTQDLVITSITPGGVNGDLVTIDSALPLTLPAGGLGTIDLTFTPNSPGAFEATLTIASNDAATPTKEIELTFEVQDPIIAIEDLALDFGILPNAPGPQVLTVTVTNTGSTEDLIISGLLLTGSPQFTHGPIPSAIPAGESADLEITLTPGSGDGFFTGSLLVESNDFNMTTPEIPLIGFVAPANTIAASFDFDPNEVFDITLDIDGSTMNTWITSNLTDLATGTGALGGGNQTGTNRVIGNGATGNYLRFSSARESDAQTPVLAGGNDESTWSTFSISPTPGAGPLGFSGGEAVVQTYAFNGIGGNNQTDWTLYYSLDEGGNWISLGTLAGAGISTVGESGPLALRWDLTPIGTQSSPVEFILDPVATASTNGTADQRGTGFDNLYLTLGTASQLAISKIENINEGSATLTWTGNPGTYAIDYSLDLSEGSWLELTDGGEILAGSNIGTETVILPAAETSRNRIFYRVRVAE